MIAKLFATFSIVAVVAVAEPCNFCGEYSSIGYGSNHRNIINSNVYGNVYPSRVLNAACTVPAVSSYPVGSPVATPAVLSPYDLTIATPVLSSGVVRSRLCGQRTFSGLLSSF